MGSNLFKAANPEAGNKWSSIMILIKHDLNIIQVLVCNSSEGSPPYKPNVAME